MKKSYKKALNYITGLAASYYLADFDAHEYSNDRDAVRLLIETAISLESAVRTISFIYNKSIETVIHDFDELNPPLKGCINHKWFEESEEGDTNDIKRSN